MAKIGQRYSYTDSGSPAVRFVAEVVAVANNADMKIVQKNNWSDGVGYVYKGNNLERDSDHWHLLEGQDKPEA